MNDDDRLSRYLADQASSITLSPEDPDAVMRRGTRRRNRRRGAIVGLAAVAVAASSFAVIYRDEPDAKVDSSLASSASVVASPLDWTVVPAEHGLGYSRSTVLVEGAVYSLSTAPGPYDDDGSFEPTLYRSDDGAAWSEVSLPDGVRPSSLASSDGTLYAIGTSPAGGGGRDLVVSASTDGAATWASVTLPAELAAVDARHPGEIMLSQPSVAATDASHLVATVVVSAYPDVEALLPGVADPNAGWEITPEGVTVYELEPCDSAECGAMGTGSTVPRREALKPEEPKVKGTYSWDDLDLDPELRALIGGKTYVYVSDDGTSFEQAAVPDSGPGWGGQVLATDDGYRLFLGQSRDNPTTQVLRSEDGHTWTDAGTLSGTPQSAGLLGGRPAVALFDVDGGIQVQIEQAAGSWTALDLLSAVDTADRSAGIGDVAFGPLGIAAVVWIEDAAPGGALIVHSLDGTSLSSIAVGDHIEGDSQTIGLSVSADAILVRVDGPPDGDAATPPTQQVLVGTPR